jgi:hypothetical protein
MTLTNSSMREEVALLRGGEVVSSLAGAFGTALRETRLTALLGYLIALEPSCFLCRFGFSGKPLSVSLETFHNTGRSDILIETTDGVGIVEAKVDATDPSRQAKKYPAKWRVLVTQYTASTKQRQMLNMTYLRWGELAALLKELAASSNRGTRFVSRDLLTHLEEHNMIKKPEPVEIYAREINEPITLRLYLKARLYGCQHEGGSRLAEALYFAPHFGQAITKEHPGVNVGISYISRIETVEVVETWEDLKKVVRIHRGKQWLKKHKHIIDELRTRYGWRQWGPYSFLFLSTPRLVFNPPVRKQNIQAGFGRLSKRFLSFDELFGAWGC